VQSRVSTARSFNDDILASPNERSKRRGQPPRCFIAAMHYRHHFEACRNRRLCPFYSVLPSVEDACRATFIHPSSAEWIQDGLGPAVIVMGNMFRYTYNIRLRGRNGVFGCSLIINIGTLCLQNVRWPSRIHDNLQHDHDKQAATHFF
jgi:hypothetical protein